MRRFEDKIVFVTGGASGLGEAAARRFAEEGARVVIADVNGDAAEQVAASLPEALAVAVDTSDSAQVERAVATAVEHYGRIDVVFNNAGITGEQQPLHETTEENWRRVVGVDGDGAFHVLKHGIAAMLRTGGGAIVNMSSTAGITAQPNISGYSFAKAGVVGLTRSAAVEYADRGIRVNAVAPTTVMTPLVKDFIASAEDPEAMFEMLNNFNPMPGFPEVEDVAAVVAFLASDDARWVTGHTVPVDGGYVAR
jgi:NAD(P)-dependent dehydrogenase (short-subunit alcohol dehydrogenase family)